MSVVERDQVIEELSKTENFNQHDFQMGVNKTEFAIDNDNMVLRVDNKHEYLLSEEAFTKASRMCGIPESYVKKFPTEEKHMLNDHLTYWFNKRDDDVKLLLDPDRTTVVAMTKGSVDYYSRIQMFEEVENVLAPTDRSSLLYDKVHNSMDKGTHFAVVSQKQQFMKPGDLVRGGVQIQDHVLGDLPLTVTAYVWRQVCGNGMLSQEAIGKWSRRGAIDNLYDWIRQTTEDAHNAVDLEFHRIHELQNIAVENHGADVLKAVFAEFKVPSRFREVITDNVVNDGAETMYDIWNAFTQAANHEDFADNPSMIRSLQGMAGGIAVNSHFCPSCHSILHG